MSPGRMVPQAAVMFGQNFTELSGVKLRYKDISSGEKLQHLFRMAVQNQLFREIHFLYQRIGIGEIPDVGGSVAVAGKKHRYPVAEAALQQHPVVGPGVTPVTFR